MAGCGSEQAQTTGVQAPEVPITAAKAVQKDVPVQLKRIGTVEAYSSVGVKAQVGGVLEKVHFREGQDVRQGDLLFEIDARPYQQAVRQAEANLARDQAQLQQARANLGRDQAQAANAATEAGRYQELLNEGIISKSQNDATKTSSAALNEAVRADQAAIGSAQANLTADQAAIDKAKLDLSYCTISAPISGRTGNLFVKEGNLVKANPDNPMVVINQVSPIYVSFTVPQQELGPIRAAMAKQPLRVQVSTPDDPGAPIQGTLSFVDNAVDNNTGTIQLKAVFPNAERRLWPGLFVDVILTMGTEDKATVVPSEAVQMGQNGQYAFVVQADHTVVSRPVKTGISSGDDVVIAEGIQPGETVVTDGQLRLTPGSRVRIVDGVGAGEP